jgi:hypothetical protein
MRRFQQIPSDTKPSGERPVDRENTLGLPWRFELAHVTLSLSSRLMRDLGAVVEAPALAVGGGYELPAGHAITVKSIGHDQTGNIVQPFNNLRKKRLAPPLSRRCWTRISSTSPSWSTARQR